MAQPEKDEEFEKFVAGESKGVIDAARMMFYGSSFKRMFNPVVTNPSHPLDAHCGSMATNPVHRLPEIGSAIELCKAFRQIHPGRSVKYRK